MLIVSLETFLGKRNPVHNGNIMTTATQSDKDYFAIKVLYLLFSSL